MSKTWYGSLSNRLEENRMFCDEIKVGTGMTEYSWSDRHPYEVVEVTDQKHIKVRELDHKSIGEPMTNTWELFSNPDKPIRIMTKRGKYWYWTIIVTKDILNEIDDIHVQLFLAQNSIDIDKLKTKGKITKYHRANVSFGIAEYYYDYEF